MSELLPSGEVTIQQICLRAAATYGAHTAVVFGGASLTYAQLDAQATQLGQAILHHAPAAELIGISTTRGLEMVVGLLAILKAGKAYLPLDPTYPAPRLRQLVTDSGVATCLAHSADKAVFEELGLATIASEQAHAYPAQPAGPPSETVCVLYTSGSTGQPKGVCLGQAGLRNLLSWQVAHSVAGNGVNILQFCHLSFDVSFLEIFVALVSGGTLYVIDDTSRLDSGRLLAYLIAHRINWLFLPHVALQYLAETAEAEQCYPPDLQEVLTGGEALKITPQIRAFFTAAPHCALTNGYGPTEASVYVTQHKLRGPATSWPAIPSIGRPFAGSEIQLLDETGQPVAAGAIGELCISGECLALGYLHQPALTAEKFVPFTRPQGPAGRRYRTGDLARYLPNGEIEFQGRLDQQVKIRGNRVELGEIEVALAQQPGVQQVVVIAREALTGSKELLAYVVASPATTVATLRAAIVHALPDYMVPAHIIRLAELPKTPSGKVDRQALPAPDRQRPATVPYRQPRTTPEKQITALWASLLQYDQVGVDDNFFELGGNSLLAQKTVAALKEQGHALPITKLYQFPTAAGIAQYLAQASPATDPLREATPPASPAPDADIAVIGLAGRFPGAATIAELWEVLREGRETTQFFTPDELDPTVPAHLRHDPLYVPARGVLAGVAQFDAQFFGLNPKLAQTMDPQQRVFSK